jgi:outer membrane receptor protein involved in Fe transport
MFKNLLTLTLCLLIGGAAWAQKATLKGKVTDATSKEGLPMATVRVGNTGAATEADGSYTLEVNSGSISVDFSYTGYDNVTQTVTLKSGETRTLDIALGDKPDILKTVTVTSGRYEKPLGEVTVSLDIIKPSMIENASTISIDKAIEKVPGVSVIDGQANIRGGSGYSYGAGSRVLLLVNDLPALQGDAGYPNWNDVPVENIEQVEVVKGAASALYGSSALNGIINIRTGFAKSEPVTKFGTAVTMFGAPKDTKRQWWKNDSIPYEASAFVAHRQKFGKFDLAISSFYSNQQSFRKGAYTEYGRLSSNMRYRFSERLSVGLNFNVNKGRSASFFLWNNDSTGAYIPLMPFGGAPVLTFSKTFRTSIDPYITYNDKSGNTHKILTRWFHVVNDNNNNQGNSSDFSYGEYQFTRRMDAIDMTVVAGLVGSQTTTVAQLYGGATLFSSNLAGYLQLDKKFSLVKDSKFHKLNLSFGARYESNQITNPTIIDSLATEYYKNITGRDTTVRIMANKLQEAKPVFRAGLSYQPAEYTFIRASWGQGYRYPTVAEKFIQTRVSLLNIYSNANLQSETGYSAEFGIKQGVKISDWKGFVDVAGFYNAYSNMMEFTFGGAEGNRFGFQSLNIGDTEIKGAEISFTGYGKLFGKETSLLAGYTYIDPKFKVFDARQKSLSSADYNVLKYRFRHTLKADIESQILKQISVGLSYQYLSRMEAVDYVFIDDKTITDPNDPHITTATGFIGGILAPGTRHFMDTHNNGTNIVDARIAFVPNKHFRLSFLVKNIFNEEYVMRPALLEAPRNFTLRFDATF